MGRTRQAYRPHHSFPLTPRAVSFSVWLSDGDDEMDYKLPSDHYLNQFDRYPEGPERFAAACAHISYVRNHAVDQQNKMIEKLQSVLDRLVGGDVPAAIAIDIHEFLEEVRI